MYAAIYTFEVKQNHETTFIKSWEELTKLIHKYCGSLGSRLHKTKEGLYVAYAYWPSEEVWEASSEKLPEEEAESWRKQMYESCHNIETVHTLNTVSDLLA